MLSRITLLLLFLTGVASAFTRDEWFRPFVFATIAFAAREEERRSGPAEVFDGAHENVPPRCRLLAVRGESKKTVF